ncbi:MAG: hypothetical protein JNG84_07970 [Archangium sp.]|nr:hypothetical protein [Archangium sp.]
MGRSAAVVVAMLVAMPAAAQDFGNDFQLVKLGNPQEGAYGYSPRADGNFRAFARQMAAAISSVNLMPPETLGHSGFNLSAEVGFVSFGTGSLPTSEDFRGSMVVPSVHIRKGLPSSFELGARAAWLERSHMGAGTLELKWAINEGFTYLPDIGVRGSVTKLINSRDFDLTTGGLDIGIGKQFAIAGMVTVTPYAGWSLLFVGASTGNIDFRPSRTLAESDTAGEQFNDFFVFSAVQAAANSYSRFYGGLRFIGGVVQLGGEISYSLLGSFRDVKTGEDRPVAGVLVGSFTLGLDF